MHDVGVMHYALEKRHLHTSHKRKWLCSNQIKEDLEYRHKMGFSDPTYNVLYQYPQWLYVRECNESREGLTKSIMEYSKMYGIVYDESEWILYKKWDEVSCE